MINSKIYIGKTINFKYRKWRHLYDARNNNEDSHFYRAINKYGKDKFEWYTIDSCITNEYDLYELEKFYIEKFHSSEFGYNENSGGIGQFQYKMSEETKNKIAKANTGQKRSAEQKLTMSNSAKGKSKSESHKLNLSLSMKGRKGKSHTKESKQKISDAQLHKKKILCLNTGITYESTSKAAELLGIQRRNIVAHLRRRRWHVGGYVFRYL